MASATTFRARPCSTRRACSSRRRWGQVSDSCDLGGRDLFEGSAKKLLTAGPWRPTVYGVGAMPDPSRPSAPEVTALVDRARRRDPEAFRGLFQTHVAAIHRLVRRMVGA